MQMTERQILKSVMSVTEKIPTTLSVRDSQFVLDATNAVIHNLFDAEEPMNKPQRHYEEAKRITNNLQSFIQHRELEQWGNDSSYPYVSQQVTENRAV